MFLHVRLPLGLFAMRFSLGWSGVGGKLPFMNTVVDMQTLPAQ